MAYYLGMFIIINANPIDWRTVVLANSPSYIITLTSTVDVEEFLSFHAAFFPET